MSKPVQFTICNCGNPDGHKGPVWHPGQPIPPGVKLTEQQLVGMLMRPPKGAEFSLGVARCGCPDRTYEAQKLTHGLMPDGVTLKPCPRPRSQTDLGIVSAWYSNPFKRLHWLLVGKRKADQRIRAEAQS